MDTKQTDYNAAAYFWARPGGRVCDACHEFGLKVGFYYSMTGIIPMARCAPRTAARRRFLDFTQGCVRELCSNYKAGHPVVRFYLYVPRSCGKRQDERDGASCSPTS